MPTISLTTFLKILTQGTPQKAKEYGKYLTPGGYNFYWRLKEAARGLTIGDERYVDCVKSIEKITNQTERECNLKGLKAFQNWIDKNKVTDFFDAPAGNCRTPQGFATIKLDPEFGMVLNNSHRIVQIWCSKNSSLSKTAISVGIYLLEKNLCVGEFADCKAGILDLRKHQLFVADALPTNVDAMLAGEFAWLDSFFSAHSKAA